MNGGSILFLEGVFSQSEIWQKKHGTWVYLGYLGSKKENQEVLQQNEQQQQQIDALTQQMNGE